MILKAIMPCLPQTFPTVRSKTQWLELPKNFKLFNGGSTMNKNVRPTLWAPT